MASPNIYAATGGTIGADLLTRAPVYMTGVVLYVSSQTGVDTNVGTDRLKPVATLAKAITLASAGDTIVLMENHAETITSAVTINLAGLLILGEGSGSTRPQLTCGATIAMLDVTAVGVQIRNVYFPASTAAPTARIRSASTSTIIDDCYFECGPSDTGPAVKLITGAGAVRVTDCFFASTSSASETQPANGLEIANAMNDLTLERVTFDKGLSSWSDYALKGTAAVTRLYGIDVSLVHGSDAIMATGWSGVLHVRSASGAAKVVLTA